MKRDITKLPKWAQELIRDQRTDIEMLQSLKKAHAVLDGREWFTINGPSKMCPESLSPDGWYYLFYLYPSGAHPACSIGPNDVLLVGRDTNRVGAVPCFSAAKDSAALAAARKDGR